MTCPVCGSPCKEIDGVVQYHTRTDNLAACNGPEKKTEHKAAENDEPKKPTRKRTTKKA